MICSHLEYAVCVWNAHHQYLIEKLEKVLTLKYRRIRGDMIELYKIFAGIYINVTTEWITGKHIERQYDTRNHRFALHQLHFIMIYDMHKFGFSNRIISLWNSLPDYVVSSPTTNTFKAHIDKFWENKDVRYNLKADILFTRSRSKVEYNDLDI